MDSGYSKGVSDDNTSSVAYTIMKKSPTSQMTDMWKQEANIRESNH